jgi:CheY-like chemotaxis protein
VDKVTVLHIEDSNVEREIVRKILEDGGFEVIDASNSQEGIEKARESPPDLILVDLHLQDVDGCETARSIRNLPGLERVPIVALSATISEEEEKRCEGIFDAFVRKPVDAEEFPGLARELMQRGRKEGADGEEGTVESTGREAPSRSPELEEVLQTLEKVRAAMSHDLRTPLTVMISYASTVGKEKVGRLNAKQKEMLDLVVDHGFQMDTLISELVRIARRTLDRYR